MDLRQALPVIIECLTRYGELDYVWICQVVRASKLTDRQARHAPRKARAICDLLVKTKLVSVDKDWSKPYIISDELHRIIFKAELATREITT